MITTVRIHQNQISDIVPLFDAYRVFYKMKSNIVEAYSFLNDRILKDESIIFAAYKSETAVGFVQLFKTFSSVSLESSLILNDLFVAPQYRNNNIGETLLLKSQEFCIANNYKGLALETAIDNPAQKLYKKLGWRKDSHCFHYFWAVK